MGTSLVKVAGKRKAFGRVPMGDNAQSQQKVYVDLDLKMASLTYAVELSTLILDAGIVLMVLTLAIVLNCVLVNWAIGY